MKDKIWKWKDSDLAELNKLNHKPQAGKAKKQPSATKEPQELAAPCISGHGGECKTDRLG